MLPMIDARFAIGERVTFGLGLTTRIHGYVRAIRFEDGAHRYRIALDHGPQRQRWLWFPERMLKPAETTEPVYRKCSDIPDLVLLAAIDRALHERTDIGYTVPTMATRWDVASVLAGRPELAGMGEATRDWPGVPPKLLLAKVRRLDRRGLICGCACGCRGDFEITVKGREFQRARADRGVPSDEAADDRGSVATRR